MDKGMSHSRKKAVQHVGLFLGAVLASFEVRGEVVLRGEYEML
jgi:hypothetical protein